MEATVGGSRKEALAIFLMGPGPEERHIPAAFKMPDGCHPVSLRLLLPPLHSRHTQTWLQTHTWLQLCPGDTEVTSVRFMEPTQPCWNKLARRLLVWRKSHPRIAAIRARQAAQLQGIGKVSRLDQSNMHGVELHEISPPGIIAL